MKKTIIALVAVTLAMPAYADHPTIRGEYLNYEFETRGECESTLKRERNERRQAGGDPAITRAPAKTGQPQSIITSSGRHSSASAIPMARTPSFCAELTETACILVGCRPFQTFGARLDSSP